MANRSTADTDASQRKTSLRNLSIFTYLLGLLGLSFSITCAMWVYLSLSLEYLMPPLLSKRSTVFLFVALFLLALFSSIAAWISGVMVSRRARELGKTGHRRWRMGLYMGVFAVLLLVSTFVVLVSYSMHILLYQLQYNFNSKMV
jgi:uncharacterized membrane protein YhaH (DUF805 family)